MNGDFKVWLPDPDREYSESILLDNGFKKSEILQLRADIYNTSGREPDAYLGGIVLNYMMRAGRISSGDLRGSSMEIGIFCDFLGLMMGDVTEVLERRKLMRRKPAYPRAHEESSELRVNVGSAHKFMQIPGGDEEDEDVVPDGRLEQALRVLSNGKQRIVGPSDNVARRYSDRAEQSIYPIDPEQFQGVEGIVGSWQGIAVRLFYAANRGEFDYAEAGPQEKDGYVYFLTAEDIGRYCFHPDERLSWRAFVESIDSKKSTIAQAPGLKGNSA